MPKTRSNRAGPKIPDQPRRDTSFIADTNANGDNRPRRRAAGEPNKRGIMAIADLPAKTYGGHTTHHCFLGCNSNAVCIARGCVIMCPACGAYVSAGPNSSCRSCDKAAARAHHHHHHHQQRKLSAAARQEPVAGSSADADMVMMMMMMNQDEKKREVTAAAVMVEKEEQQQQQQRPTTGPRKSSTKWTASQREQAKLRQEAGHEANQRRQLAKASALAKLVFAPHRCAAAGGGGGGGGGGVRKRAGRVGGRRSSAGLARRIQQRQRQRQRRGSSDLGILGVAEEETVVTADEMDEDGECDDEWETGDDGVERVEHGAAVSGGEAQGPQED